MVVVVGVVAGATFYVRGRAIMEAELKDKLRTTASMAALQFDPADVDAISGVESLHTPVFHDIAARLDAIRDAGPNVRFAYLMRRTDDPMILEFVADADALLSEEELDRDQNGTVEPDEEPSFPGDPYPVEEVPALQAEAFEHATSDEEITVDQWGELISGYAPIRRADGTVAAVLGIDMEASEYRTLSQSIFSPVAFLLFMLATGATGMYVIFTIWRRRQELLKRIADERTGLMRLTFHQLGTPLTIVKWSLEQLKDAEARGELQQALREHYTSLEDGIGRINAILEDLKEADRVSEHALVFTPVPCAVKDIVKDAVEDMQKRFEQRKHTITVHGDAKLRMTLDRVLIGAVLRELLDNAINYSAPKTPITVSFEKSGRYVKIRVTDHGAGIPEKDMPRIFERFTRGSNAATLYPDGAGLGLYIARGIVEQAGGRMTIQSREKKGTTITFTLPLA